MSTVLVTGSAGLIGSESVHFFAEQGFNIIGIDNDMRSVFFGESASTSWNRNLLQEKYGDRYLVKPAPVLGVKKHNKPEFHP